MEGWSGISLSAVTSTGDLKQLYPTWAPTGTAKASATNGQQIKGPCEGILHQVQVKTDGVNGGTIEIWDLNGDDAGVDVSSATAITDAQLTTLKNLKRAKLIYSQNFQGAPTTPFGTGFRPFQLGLAARFIAGAGACELNLVVGGGFRLTTKVG